MVVEQLRGLIKPRNVPELESGVVGASDEVLFGHADAGDGVVVGGELVDDGARVEGEDEDLVVLGGGEEHVLVFEQVDAVEAFVCDEEGAFLGVAV